ncbi:pentatricopeptide repeat-containing protein ELI1, chloroplastic [Heracleum sosnowskyi]|uniref:Pentatricopeptide repeat-containing protein ELI1, chloroplastic n=1 Tax=Heracleum sosnowskyi TaxID=360622 RepID=A0AAD8N3S1_9APIA|nr:pentatricopeptide repeat-containing protein ELI1, chloroplastic [Heracleum sosnowskyi]
MSSLTTFYTSPPPPLASVKHHRNHLAPDRLATLIDNSKTIKQLIQIHGYLLRNSLETHPILNLKLQRSYSILGRLDYSITLFDRTHNPDVFFYSTIILGHVNKNLHSQALQLYVEMLSRSIEPNAFTFSAILKNCPISSAKGLHGQAIKMGCDLNTYVRTGLVDIYARGGDVVLARQLFDTMPDKSLVSVTTMMTGLAKHGDVDGARALFDGMVERDVVCWNVIIDGYVQHGRPNEALFLFRQMLSDDVCPDGVTLVAVFSACGQLGALESGRWVHAYMKNKRIRMNVHVGTALVDMYSKCGCLEDARLVFDEIKSKDVVVWNAMISGYAMNGLSEEALQLFSDMCRLNVPPTEITFIGILSVCAHAGLVHQGSKFFQSMRGEYGIEPRIEHYGCIVNLLGRVGQLDEAFQLVKAMNINADQIIWRTLLDACRLHGNNELGEEIVKFYTDQNLGSSGACILVSNIYAAANNWNGVQRVRTMMKDTGIQKEPGCSSIEVNNTVHEFLAGDIRHPKRKEIYLMLEELNRYLKDYDNIPQQT